MVTVRVSLAGAPGTGVEALRRALLHRSAEANVILELDDVTQGLLAGIRPPVSVGHPPCCLLMGLDALPPGERRQADGVDLRLRQALGACGWSYAVVYGAGEQRVEAAWRLLQPSVGRAPAPVADESVRARLRPCCPECLVPECEHRLFRFGPNPPSGY